MLHQAGDTRRALLDTLCACWSSRPAGARLDGGAGRRRRPARRCADGACCWSRTTTLNQQIAVELLSEPPAWRSTSPSNGIVAVEMVRSTQYDLVLMDVQMPEMDGLSATRRDPRADRRERGCPSSR
ncbi:MAG: response regulator [Rubrivivax sp.]